MHDFIKAITAKNAGRVIIAEFVDGSTADYTDNILNYLLTDNAVKNIMDGETGEILFYRNERGEMITA